MALSVGSKMPEFKATVDGGKEISLSEFQGKWIVLYFYPKDNTSGCTKEACSFRDSMDELTKLGAEVIGVSPDSVKSHDNFIEKFNLNFHLISDKDKKICEMFGVIGEKKMYGKTYMGIIRSSFIINPQGIISYVNPKVTLDGHVEEIKNKIIELKGQ